MGTFNFLQLSALFSYLSMMSASESESSILLQEVYSVKLFAKILKTLRCSCGGNGTIRSAVFRYEFSNVVSLPSHLSEEGTLLWNDIQRNQMFYLKISMQKSKNCQSMLLMFVFFKIIARKSQMNFIGFAVERW